MEGDVTETRGPIRRGDGKLFVRITYTPRTGRPVKMHRLRIEVDEERTVGCSPYVFVYQSAVCGRDGEDAGRMDEFLCVADELDENEIPTEESGPDVPRGVPFYRTKAVELLFRNSDLMYECARSIVESLVSP